jgi:hypothetical protein
VIVQALEGLAAPTGADLDVTTLEGHAPWRRLRLGDWRVIFRPLQPDELETLGRVRPEPMQPGTLWIERIVNRRDLQRAIRALG